MPVRRELDARSEPGLEIIDKPASALAVPAADEVGQDELRIRVNRGPRPRVARAIRCCLRLRYVLLLGVGERPNLIDLHPPRLDVADVLVVVGGAHLARVHQQLCDRVLAGARYPRDRADRHALTEKLEDARAVVCGKLVHGSLKLSDTGSLSSILVQFAFLRKLSIFRHTMTSTDARTPGQLISELLRERGWTNRVLAVVLGVSDPIVSKIASDKRPIDAVMALALEDVFGIPAQRFVDLQGSYDLAKARIEFRPDPKRALRANIYGRLPIAELIKRGWIELEDARDPDRVEAELCRFFKVNRLEDATAFAFSAKKTDAHLEATPEQLTWLHRVKTIASEMLIGTYSPQKLEDAILKIRVLRSHPEHMSRIPKILAEAGIRFVVVEGLPGGKIDGVCFWLNEYSPVVGMSLRFDRIDNFVFVLRHELEHVRRRDGLSRPIIDEDLGRHADDELDAQERIANEEARDFCVTKRDMDAFIARKAPYFSDKDLVGFAKALKVHPGIVAGQLQFRTGKFTHFRAHLVPVREFILPAAEVDGWGNIHPIEM